MSDGPMYKAYEADKWFDRYVKTVAERDRIAAENATLRAELAKIRNIRVEWIDEADNEVIDAHVARADEGET